MANNTEKTNEQLWDETLNSPEGAALLEQLANDALKDIENGNFKTLDEK